MADLEKAVTLLVEGLRAMPGLGAATRGYIDQAHEALHPQPEEPPAPDPKAARTTK